MSLTRQIAIRFFRSKSSDGLPSLISTVSILGVGLGVLSLVAVTSVLNGFETELIRTVTGLHGEVILYSRGNPIDSAPEIVEKIKNVVPEVKAISQSFVSEVMFSGPHGVAGGIFEGVESETLDSVVEIRQKVIEGSFETGVNELVLARALAERLGVSVGEKIRVIVPFFGEDGVQPLAREFRVVGIVRLGMYQFDSKYAFSSLSNVQEFLKQDKKVTSFRMSLNPDSDALDVSNRLSDNFGYPFRAKYWGQINKNLLDSIRLEKLVIGVILAATIIVAAFNLVSTLMMFMQDKAREIALLKTIGFRKVQSFKLFIWLGLLIGGLGTGLGVLGGLVINWLLRSRKWVDIPEDIYHFGYLPVHERWIEIAMISALSILIAFFASIYPAIRVSRKPPLEGLRYD